MADAAEDYTTVFNVEMVCGGCSGAVQRILFKIDGVFLVNCDMEKQSVTVTHLTPNAELMLEKLQKWGENANKAVSLSDTVNQE
mmetsp:Transcript_51210/g.69725  ORF Transcript_51210/g.69725 Transcript_51210/m.69725 type:complete len:84 (+) Transcript_51210:38-289(+)|eukprot:CAMPEP_0185765838 /NCGR_PEP_ID=MMETSP1174-20130828/33096_1 /TAXON_ID=35687 /ORGANISM="Dictyocha speculum, Strain CCMP1381" /LENGTH=83 /DNA_ID=CAMNT_0028449227 /DNA_START=38 /DNA_END=289 /DNA_ORIENTATION=+